MVPAKSEGEICDQPAQMSAARKRSIFHEPPEVFGLVVPTSGTSPYVESHSAREADQAAHPGRARSWSELPRSVPARLHERKHQGCDEGRKFDAGATEAKEDLVPKVAHVVDVRRTTE